MGTDSLVMHRFRDADDIKYYFQRELEKFPRVDGHLKFSEFGALLVRPRDEPKNRLTHIVFPETILALPNARSSLRAHNAMNLPQVMLMADATTNDLYFKVIADRPTPDGLPERVSLILARDQVFANASVWELFTVEDRAVLSRDGFDPDMSSQEWGKQINKYLGQMKPVAYAITEMGDYINFREFPFSLNQRGAIGTSGSFYLMSRFIVDVITENQFVYDESESYGDIEEIPYEIGGAHIHPRWSELDEFQKVLATRISEDVIIRTPSISDISYLRSSRAVFRALCKIFCGKEKDTMQTLEVIVETDKEGQVTSLRIFDFGDADMEELERLNDLALETVENPTMDLGIIAEHYNFIDSLTKTDFGTPGNSEHLGDPDYDRLAVST